MATFYVTQTGAGTADGTSLANAWSVADFNTAGNWGAEVGEIEAGDTVLFYPDGGDIATRLTPQGSGTSAAARITLKGVGATITTGINGSTFDYIAVLGFTFTQPTTGTAYACVALNAGNGWLIQNNTFQDTYYGAVGGTASNTIIRRNTADNIGGTDGGSGGGSSPVVFSLTGNDNLIEYNSVLESLDRTRILGSRNIIRNNYWGATDTADYPDSDPYPHHTDGFQGLGTALIEQLLYERNFDTDNGDSVGGTNAHGYLLQDNNDNGDNFTITRFNIVVRPGGVSWQTKDVDESYVYNETWYAINNQAGTAFRRAHVYEGGTNDSDVADFRNNTLTLSPNCLESTGWYDIVADVTNITHGTNHTFAYGGTESSYPASAGTPANLTKADPLFTDRTTSNFTLAEGSPLIDAGSSVIVAVGAGSDSTALTLSVAHSKFISDGWGIADADWINFDGGAFVQVDSIDYGTGAVTLASAATWDDGATVMVRGMKDVGALPEGAGAAPAIASGVVTDAAGTASVTVSDAFNVRFVELLVDGLPVATQYTPTGNVYALTWTGDGNPSHNFTAVAYSAWASATPTVELQIYVSQAAAQVKTLRSPVSVGMGV